MNALLFATYNVTPEEWADFRRSASVPELDIGPYILVSSRVHKDFEEETKEIEAPIESELRSTTYGEIKELFTAMAEPNHFNVYTHFFLLLDEQSPKDRKVVITQRAAIPLNAEGTYLTRQARASGEKAAETKVEWKRHRVPYKEANTTIALLVAKGGLEFEPYLEEEPKEEFIEEG